MKANKLKTKMNKSKQKLQHIKTEKYVVLNNDFH